MRFSLFLFLAIFSASSYAQTKEVGEEILKEVIDGIIEDLPDEYDLSELTEKLYYRQKHPINLNHTNVDELKELIFLSPLQISSLLFHIAGNGKLIDVLELQSVANFDLTTIERLLHFVEIKASDLVDEITRKNITATANQDLVIRFARVLQKQKGFEDLSATRYVGTPEKLLLRYKYNFANRISASVILEKDAGERLIRKEKSLLIDYQSVHLALNQFGPFKTIVLGDYSLTFGQGITLWSGFGFGKAADVTSLAKKGSGLKPYSSANEYSFLRGLATTVQIGKHLELSNFISTRKLDASLSIDSNGKEVLSTINETGLHRTANELKNTNSIKQQSFGMILRYQKSQADLGLIAHQTHFNKMFITGSPNYKLYDFAGNKLINFGFNYSYTFKNCYLFGEVAKDDGNSFAHLAGLLVSLSSKVSCAIQYRNYNKEYHNFFAQAIAEGGKVSNENGGYISLNINPTKKLSVAFYSDYFSFPWLKFRIDAPSTGHETFAQISYIPNKKTKVTFRYRSESKSQNTDLELPINYLEQLNKTSYRLEANWPLNSFLTCQNRFEISQFQKGISATEIGIMSYQDVNYSPLRSKLAGNVRLAFFHTRSYDSRIYAYEDDVLYNFSFGLYNGTGWRSYLNLKYNVAKKLDLWMRYATFLYQNVTTTGSGLDEIQGSNKTELKLQVRYQF